ncbi:MAG: hypothetical protein ACK4F9_07875, partial [Brevinematia bacterium]
SKVIHYRNSVKKIFLKPEFYSNFIREVRALRKLQKYDFIPKLMNYNEKELSIEMERVEGMDLYTFLREFNKSSSLKEIKIWKIFQIIFRICFILDLEGVYKDEWNRPFKHVIFTDKGVKIIDFDRAVFYSSKRNLTQFMSFVFNFCNLSKDMKMKELAKAFSKFYDKYLNLCK